MTILSLRILSRLYHVRLTGLAGFISVLRC